MQSVVDAEILARRRLPRILAMLIEIDEPRRAFGRNLAAFEEVAVRPRAGVAFPEVDTRTTVLGQELALPVIVAPTGNIRVFHPDAEPGVARAAGAAGTAHCVSTFTGHPIEDVVAASAGPVWFQLYPLGGRANAEEMIDRAQRAGCRALVLTMDTAATPITERPLDERAYMPMRIDVASALRFLPQAIARPRWLAGFLRDRMDLSVAMVRHPDGRKWLTADANAAITERVLVWEDLAWIREQWDGPIVVKGLLSADDARRAVHEGAGAVVVSNHGGHMFASSPASLRILPEVVDAVGEQVDVLFDSGIRRGEDVVKAIALGARAVLIGRGYLWAHAAAGEAGVRRILEVFRAGIEKSLIFAGCPSLADLDRSCLVLPDGFARGG
jgi:isopentenyl diphosphate isomerase/L-lactate dehydrogenase-like FMN-dependent dehydrogenase